MLTLSARGIHARSRSTYGTKTRWKLEHLVEAYLTVLILLCGAYAWLVGFYITRLKRYLGLRTDRIENERYTTHLLRFNTNRFKIWLEIGFKIFRFDVSWFVLNEVYKIIKMIDRIAGKREIVGSFALPITYYPNGENASLMLGLGWVRASAGLPPRHSHLKQVQGLNLDPYLQVYSGPGLQYTQGTTMLQAIHEVADSKKVAPLSTVGHPR